jgi:hypothetical protein
MDMRGCVAGHSVAAGFALLMAGPSPAGQTIGRSAGDQVVQMLAEDRPYHRVSPELFDRLGWNLPRAVRP